MSRNIKNELVIKQNNYLVCVENEKKERFFECESKSWDFVDFECMNWFYDLLSRE